MSRISIFYVLFIVFLSSCTEQNLIVKHSNSEVSYSGRVHHQKECTDLYWSGSSVKMNFEGKEISVSLKDEKKENYYNIIVDNQIVKILNPDSIQKSYILATNLSNGKHHIEIFKRTEWTKGKTSFYGFTIKKGKILPKNPPLKRKMEFYGNSITAGYAIEDTSGKDLHDSIYTNNYKSYASITARYYNAEYRCICRSGIGVTISWFPMTMPQMYDRLIPADANSKWNFSSYTPDIVVINLFQNDSWLIKRPNRTEFISSFGKKIPNDVYFINAYQKFVSQIRNHYPKAKIICSLGSMDACKPNSKWLNYITKAVENLNDKNIYTHFYPFKNTKGHPSEKEQQTMAESLILFIDKHIQW
ncbi:MAG: electron transporter RnfD [Flavobacteriaceae bacterium]|nr:electron transporter RnfD [Flavobacteriaceae bacterium]